jgi:uroporphyrinogen-III synthase
MKILRIRSEEAGTSLAEALKQRGAKVKDLPIYRTLSCPTETPPPHDAVFLASSSAAKAWLASATDHTKEVIAMGEPTAAILRKAGIEPAVVAPVQTVEEALFAYAVRCTHV